MICGRSANELPEGPFDLKMTHRSLSNWVYPDENKYSHPLDEKAFSTMRRILFNNCIIAQDGWIGLIKQTILKCVGNTQG